VLVRVLASGVNPLDTKIRGIVDRAHVQAGQKVLVHAGAGGVGYIAAQPGRR
jgi:NADPH2:quinone reductase